MLPTLVLLCFGLTDALTLQTQHVSLSNTASGEKFHPVEGKVGQSSATLPTSMCVEDSYVPSNLEVAFKQNANALTASEDVLCKSLGDHSRTWLNMVAGSEPVDKDASIFSQVCKRGESAQLIEPLAGLLRDPRWLCGGDPKEATAKEGVDVRMSIEWLQLADSSVLKGGKKILFDAGGTHFTDAMRFFTSAYEKRGIVFDEIYVWEATTAPEGFYWDGATEEEKNKWQSKLTFYNGVPVSAEKGAEHNVVDRIRRQCKPEDFCAFKLDIDTPKVELPIVDQILDDPEEMGSKLDEFFFEHHVNGLMQKWGWKNKVHGTFQDSYDIFTKMREMGIRAHSWV